MNKKFVILFTLITACFMLNACSSSNVGNDATVKETAVSVSETNGDTKVEASSVDNSRQDIFAQIIEADHIEIADAYNLLNDVETLSEDENALCQTLSLLKDCSGRFVQQSEETGNRYTADVAFYLVKGEIYCSIEYTGYMGEISDGIVSESQMDGYSFEAFPKGNFYGREQDFKIYFANEKLYISWADTCEYTLTRGDGSADSVQEHRGNLEESGLLDSVISVVDSNYADFEHSVFYDEDNRSLYIYIQGMDNLRAYLAANNSDLIEAWQGVTDNAVTLSETLYDALNYYVDHVYVCWVDTLNPSNTYAQSEILFQAENGNVKYNVIADNSNT